MIEMTAWYEQNNSSFPSLSLPLAVTEPSTRGMMEDVVRYGLRSALSPGALSSGG